MFLSILGQVQNLINSFQSLAQIFIGKKDELYNSDFGALLRFHLMLSAKHCNCHCQFFKSDMLRLTPKATKRLH